jgi:hypothetical protein
VVIPARRFATGDVVLHWPPEEDLTGPGRLRGRWGDVSTDQAEHPGAAEHSGEVADDPPTTRNRARGLQEAVAVVLLAVTAILTAWTGFQSSKWGGAMSTAFSRASSARVEAARHDNDAATRQAIQVGLFTQWVQAVGAKDTTVSTFISARFPEPLATAFQDWLATRPLVDPSAPRSPFDMPSYRIPERGEAAAADSRADAKFQEALRNNQRGDNYTVLTVLFAVVLFFGAMSTRITSYAARWVILGLAIATFLAGTGLLIALPKLV